MKYALLALLFAAPVAAQVPPAPPPLMQEIVAGIQQYTPSTVGSLNLGKGFSVSLSVDIGDFYTVGVRDWNNGQWLGGWGKELFPILYKGNETAYIGLQNVFNADEGGKGAIGGTLGIRPLKLLNVVGDLAGAVKTLWTVPPWVGQLSNFMSIEMGYAYRIQNSPGVTRNVATIGGQIRVPFDLIRGL